MHTHGLPMSRLRLEITETVLVQDHERTLQTILAARQAGPACRSMISVPAIRA
jgi:EAL domain-containing protein (putative c-di-GMP-specific phosphodiesterase class I)